ncbi:MAG: NDP-sugar synthase [Deltaproteobacteria bacterium]|nr:NDP-sugar synthase [Deltaproteobacteria bacterium]
MKAMILAAGLGTRLRPLTSKIPKALVPVANRPAIDWNIEYLKAYGVTQIVVNAHQHLDMVSKHLNLGKPFGLKIDLRFEPKILGTGGGIRNTADFWDKEPFIVVNGDILTNIDLSKACYEHRKSGALATLVLHDYGPFNKIQINKQFQITDIPVNYDSKKSERLAFTGIQILEPEIFRHIPAGIFCDIIDCHRWLIMKGKQVRAYIAEGHDWHDIGTPGSYINANKWAVGKNPVLVGHRCRIDKTATLEGWAVIGNETDLHKNVLIQRSILWDRVKVKEGIRIIDSIVTSSKEVRYDLINKII